MWKKWNHQQNHNDWKKRNGYKTKKSGRSSTVFKRANLSSEGLIKLEGLHNEGSYEKIGRWIEAIPTSFEEVKSYEGKKYPW